MVFRVFGRPTLKIGFFSFMLSVLFDKDGKECAWRYPGIDETLFLPKMYVCRLKFDYAYKQMTSGVRRVSGTLHCPPHTLIAACDGTLRPQD
jgi:hypothetical protein